MDEQHFQHMWEEKERKRVSRRRWNGVFLAAVFIGGAYMFSNNSNTQSTSADIQTEQVEAKDNGVKIVKIGDVVKLNNLEITVNESEERPYIEGAESQGKVVLVGVSVLNNDKESRTIDDSMFQVTVGGKTYDPDNTLSRYANDGESLFYEKVNPGLSVQSYIAFEVPENLSGYDFLVTGGVGTEASEQTLVTLN